MATTINAETARKLIIAEAVRRNAPLSGQDIVDLLDDKLSFFTFGNNPGLLTKLAFADGSVLAAKCAPAWNEYEQKLLDGTHPYQKAPTPVKMLAARRMTAFRCEV